MTDFKDKRSLFEAQPSSAASGEKKSRPAPPSKAQKPPHLNSSSTNAPLPSKHSLGETSGEKVSKLNPALLKNLEQPARGALLPARSPVIMGGGRGAKAKSLSPALKKKTKSSSKLPPKPSTGGSGVPGEQMNKLGVGLLASVTRDVSASTGNLESNSFSKSKSSSSVYSKGPPSPPSLHRKSTSPPKSRKAAALSMDVSRVTATSLVPREKSPRPVSTGTPHRIPGSPGRNLPEISPRPPLSSYPHIIRSPSGNPSLTRSRNDSFDSFEDSYSPPQTRRSPANHTPSPRIKSTIGHVTALSKSTENLLEDSVPGSVTKSRSSSDCVLTPLSPVKKKPKPTPPPKKPGLVSKPAPPPKPSAGQLKKPAFVCHAVPPSQTHTHEIRSKRTTPELASPTHPLFSRGPTSTSPPLTSSPNPAAPRRGDFSGVNSPHPSTPSPRTSQLEAVQRNADSGFASETAEDLASPITETTIRLEGEGGGGGREGEKRGGGEGVEVCEQVPEGEKKAEEMAVEVWDEARLEKARNKRFHIAEELLSTEATYVERLHIIAVKFHGAVTEFNTQHKHIIPDADINRIFLNISQIHHLNTNIHEELRKRMDTWSTQEGLGDVIERLAPFLKLYAHYTAGFEDAMKLLTAWTKRDKKFDALVREFERELPGLGVAHYMLEPIQRIPRYRLLLADYLKYTPPSSPDRLPTEKALGIISEAADHSNDRIKELENSNIILSIQRSLQDFEGTLLAPGRLFIHKGQLQKSSRKTTTPRMFFLFSDMLLHTEPTGTDVYKFKNEMPLFLMRVEEPVVSLVSHSFNVESTTRSLILVASSEAEKNEWMMLLRKAINEDMKKRSSLKREISMKVTPGVLGAQAPIMVPDKSVTMCQTCSAVFTFTFRRHHCRGCGRVVCGNCSQWKAYLPYLKKCERVCEKCNYIAKSEAGEDVDGLPHSPKTTRKKEGILDLKGYEKDTIKGGYVLSQEGRKWNRLWYQLKQDFCLYKFRAHEDIKAMSSLPLPGYIVNSDDHTHTVTLIHPSGKKELGDTFRLENPDDFDIWVQALESVVRLEVPSLPALSKISPPPDERSRSQSMRELDAVRNEGDNPLENSI